jgi:hypothetical protein
LHYISETPPCPALWGQANSQQTRPADAAAQAQQPSPVENKLPEQNKSSHDVGGQFGVQQAEASSSVLRTQPKQGKNSGIDYYRDPPHEYYHCHFGWNCSPTLVRL